MCVYSVCISSFLRYLFCKIFIHCGGLPFSLFMVPLMNRNQFECSQIYHTFLSRSCVYAMIKKSIFILNLFQSLISPEVCVLGLCMHKP